jgi:signal transduction histidine kinase
MTVADDAHPITVVLIDDTPDIRMLLDATLTQAGGFDVVAEAGNGRDGIEQVRRHQPDLVLLDLAMPVMDGLEALPLIRSAAPNAVVVVLSGFETSRMAHVAVTAGAASYIQKGGSVDEIVSTIRLALRADEPRVDHLPVHTTPDPAGGSEIDRLRSAMAIATHEMRNALNVISGAAQLLTAHRASLDDATTDRLFATIGSQGRILNRLIQDLSTSTQLEHAALDINAESIDLLDAIQASIALVDSGQEVLVTCPALQVTADPVRLHQMLTNLLLNAIKYGAPPIRVTAQPADTHAEIRVIDHGPGVPEHFRPSMFDEFTRADTMHPSGTGLGLYVVRSLAKAQGGRAWHTPTPGGGATFGITIPLAQTQLPPIDNPAGRSPARKIHDWPPLLLQRGRAEREPGPDRHRPGSNRSPG